MIKDKKEYDIEMLNESQEQYRKQRIKHIEKTIS